MLGQPVRQPPGRSVRPVELEEVGSTYGRLILTLNGPSHQSIVAARWLRDYQLPARNSPARYSRARWSPLRRPAVRRSPLRRSPVRWSRAVQRRGRQRGHGPGRQQRRDLPDAGRGPAADRAGDPVRRGQRRPADPGAGVRGAGHPAAGTGMALAGQHLGHGPGAVQHRDRAGGGADRPGDDRGRGGLRAGPAERARAAAAASGTPAAGGARRGDRDRGRGPGGGRRPGRRGRPGLGRGRAGL